MMMTMMMDYPPTLRTAAARSFFCIHCLLPLRAGPYGRHTTRRDREGLAIPGVPVGEGRRRAVFKGL